MRRAFTLAEVMVVMAVASVALLTLIGVFMLGFRWSTESRSKMVASRLASNCLETIRASGLESLPNSARRFDGRIPDPVDTTLEFPPDPYPAAVVNGQTYELAIEVEPVSSRTRNVRVEVYAPGRKALVLQSYVQP